MNARPEARNFSPCGGALARQISRHLNRGTGGTHPGSTRCGAGLFFFVMAFDTAMWRPPLWAIWIIAAAFGAGDLIALSAMSGIKSWQIEGLGAAPAICHWGITAGYGQPVCGSWGVAPFPPTSAKPVAVRLTPTLLSKPVQRHPKQGIG